METFLKGYVSSALGLVASYPIDTIKTRVQNGGSIYTTGLFKGVGAQLLFLVPAKSLRFVFFDHLSPHIQNNYLAGALAGALTALFTNPLEVHKVKRQMGLRFSVFDSYRGIIPGMLREGVMTSSVFGVGGELAERKDFSRLTSAFLASMPGCVLSIPFDTVKTRMQTTKGPLVWFDLKQGLLRGGLLRVLKALPQTTITVFVFDFLSGSV